MDRFQRYGRFTGDITGEDWTLVTEIASDRDTDPFGSERNVTIASLSPNPVHLYIKVHYSSPIGSHSEWYSVGAVNDSICIPVRAGCKIYVRHALKSTLFDNNQIIIPIVKPVEIVWYMSRGAPNPVAPPLCIRNALPNANSYSVFGTVDATSGPLFGNTAPAPYRSRMTIYGLLDTFVAIDLETGTNLFVPYSIANVTEVPLAQSVKYEVTQALGGYPYVFYTVIHGQ